ncbi:branched-chain amino acid transport system substrate-binding protein [Acetitomaculum ruminis DSM 5522]|uniref:Branched-chain amino acid transport system substrate-binding protein n=1 Tax=Acetitomaculum ruminis DSM 5522 TaxID=1120918 RepID=A0A1I0XBH5_9FIRM|nr:ABC transporter substrate-binding protein [Acetitomaculum ruminis]SFA98439.1 branched-chain amino acid transport system substrate-binding protein [Acetitomaculum ruminis DSM 5522]
MKKKIVSVLLAATLAVMSLAGCGNQASDKTSTAEGKNEVEAEEGTFLIGGIGPVTGELAIYGMAERNGAQIAVDEINEAGGVNGTKLTFNFQDDEGDAEKSVNAYNNLKDWGMQILCGTVTSTPCIAVAAKSSQDNLFQITPSGSAADCIGPDNAFRVCFSDPDQGTKSAEYIGENKLAKKVAIIYDSSDVYSSGITDKFVKEAEEQDFEIVAKEAFTADNKTDFSVQIKKAQSEGADLVFLPIYYSQAALILQQANSLGFETTFFGCDGLDGILGVENFDQKLAEGVMLLTPFAADATDELTKNFVAKYKEEYGEVPNQFAADGYDAIYAIAAALEKGECKPDMSVSDICEAMKKAMTEISIEGLTGEKITWDESGAPDKEAKAVVIKDGAYSLME